jgi:NADPH:quinone reductase-like Zn-dependent oxidoreductase
MKAVYLEELGPPEVLTLGELPDPTAGPGEIVVDIYAASINGADWKVRRGNTKGLLSSSAALPTFPYVLGRDFSGRVRSLGENVTDFQVGEEVFGVCNVGQEGTYCEQIAMKADLCAKKPSDISHVDICALALISITAVVALEETLKLQTGERLLIQGGAGGVGGVAIQLAKYLGVHVLTTTSTKNVEYVKGLGVDEIIDYTQEDFRTAVSNCDAVFDTVGGDTALGCFDVLKIGGRAAFIASGKTAPEPPSSDYTSLRPNVTRDRKHLERILELLQAKAITVPCIQTFSLEQAVEAHRLSESRHFRGKLVFQVRA